MQQTEQYDQWAILELMGRTKIAGRVTEKTIVGAGFLNVHVPETTRHPSFTRQISPVAVFAINPVDEQTARFYAERLNEAPIEAWDISAFIKKSNENILAIAAKNTEPDHFDKEDENKEADEWPEDRLEHGD